MNNLTKKATAVFATAALAISIGTPAFANPTVSNDSASAMAIANTVSSFETYLQDEGISVETEFNKSISRLENQLSNATDETERENLQNLIAGYENLFSQYKTFSDNQKNGISLAFDDTEQGYLAGMAAAIAYFDNKNYYLCSELLNHAGNDRSGRSYTPTQTAHVYATSEYQWLKSLGNVSYSHSEFSKRSSTAEADLYYSIHGYDFSKQSNKVTLSDIYDFKHESIPDYGSLIPLLGNNFMHAAQLNGIIVPFTVTFTFTV